MSNTKSSGLKDLEALIDGIIDKEQYDPHQKEEVRRELRIQYRALLEKTLEKRRELIAQDDGEKLYEMLVKSNVLFKNVRGTTEAVLDAKFLVLASDLNVKKTQAIKIGADMDVSLDDLVGKVATFSRTGPRGDEEDEMDWELIGKEAFKFSKRVYTMDFMLGPLAVQKKEIKRQRNTNITRNKEDLRIPQQLQKEDIQQQENETSNNVNAIYKVLSRVEPINYFEFVTNPESFSQTVENIFYVSFLVRKSVVCIDDTSGQPILSLHDPPNVDVVENIVDKKQVIMGIDIKDWKDIIQTYNITKPHIPTRAVKESLTPGQGWYS